jgi:hypothetical protein
MKLTRGFQISTSAIGIMKFLRSTQTEILKGSARLFLFNRNDAQDTVKKPRALLNLPAECPAVGCVSSIPPSPPTLHDDET